MVRESVSSILAQKIDRRRIVQDHQLNRGIRSLWRHWIGLRRTVVLAFFLGAVGDERPLPLNNDGAFTTRSLQRDHRRRRDPLPPPPLPPPDAAAPLHHPRRPYRYSDPICPRILGGIPNRFRVQRIPVFGWCGASWIEERVIATMRSRETILIECPLHFYDNPIEICLISTKGQVRIPPNLG